MNGQAIEIPPSRKTARVRHLCLSAGIALSATVGPLVAEAAVATYNVTTTWHEPATAPRNSVFIGSFDYDASTHAITNLKGTLSESMTGDSTRPYNPAYGPGNYSGGGDSMTWLGLDNVSNAAWGATQSYNGVTYTQQQIQALHAQYNIAGVAGGLNNQLVSSWYDAALGGTFAVTFRNATTLTCTTMMGGDGWSPQACADVGGVYANFSTLANNPGNAYAQIFVPDSLTSANTTSNPLTLSWNEANGTGSQGLAHTAYADFVPTVNPTGSYDFGGGMMGAVGMTGTSQWIYGAVGTMGGYPLSETITFAAVLESSYSDVAPTSWASPYIEAISAAGITHGCGAGKYCPTQNVTREQMAAFIVRAKEGEPATDCATPPFSDVPTTNSFCKYIQRMSALGVTTGCGGDNYCPSNDVTRDQMAAFIIRALEGNPVAAYCGATSPFSDVPASSAFCGHIKRMLELNITTGCGGGNYCPGQYVTREQMAVFLARAFLGM
jgi:hypothetical protein